MVGVVVLGALITLAWMLIQFGGRLMTPFSPASMPVHLVADTAGGISSGSGLLYRGVNVGRVERLRRAEDQLRVYIDAVVDRQPPLPGNLRAVIRSQGLVGGSASIALELIGPQPQGTLKPDQTIQAHYVGLDFLPPEFAELATELRQTARQLRESNVIGHLDEQVGKVGKLIDSIQAIMGDNKLREEVRTSLANIRSTTEKAERIADNLELVTADMHRLSNETSEQVLGLSKQTSDRLQQVSKVLDQFYAIAEKVNKGQGTAGAMVNDTRLYESLVDSARELTVTVGDLRRLVEQWEQEGVSLKMK